MKRKFIKKTVSVLLSVLLILTLTLGISAHEIYYTSSGSPIVLKWSNTLNGRAYLRINGNGLYNSSNGYDYSECVSQYNVAKSVWNNCSNLVTVESVTSSTTVYVSVPTTGLWNDLVGNNDIYNTLGCTIPRTSDGLEIYDILDAQTSSGRITYAKIYLNPFDYVFEDEYEIRCTIAHEIGHALGLGHPNGSYNYMNVASVMNQGQGIYYTPQQHDKNDITTKYG